MQAQYTGENGYMQLIQDFNSLQNSVDTKKAETLYGQTIERLSGMITEQIIEALRNYDVSETQIQTIIRDEIDPTVSEYTIQKSELTEFKNKQFGTPEIEYDQYTGRIIKMVFRQTGL